MSDQKVPSVQDAAEQSPAESPWNPRVRAIMYFATMITVGCLLKWAIESESLITLKRSIAGLAFFATLLAYTEKCLKYSYEKWADFIGTLALALAATAAGLAIFV